MFVGAELTVLGCLVPAEEPQVDQKNKKGVCCLLGDPCAEL